MEFAATSTGSALLVCIQAHSPSIAMFANITLNALNADFSVRRPLPAALLQEHEPRRCDSDGASTPSRRLDCEETDDTILLSYPDICSGDDYDADYARASELMYQRDRNFALIHDLRAVQLSSLDTSTILGDARDIAKRGKVARVAFVMECEGGFVAATIQSAIRNFCPVQPARVFSDIRSATDWCSDAGAA